MADKEDEKRGRTRPPATCAALSVGWTGCRPRHSSRCHLGAMPHSPALCTLAVSLLCPRAALLVELSCIRRVRALQLAGQPHGLRLVPGFQALRCAGAVLATTCIESNKAHEKQNALFHFAQLQRQTCFHSSPSASAIVLGSWHRHNYAHGWSCLYPEVIRSRNTR